MRLIDAERLLSEPMKSKYYHLKNGDTAVPLIDIKNAPIVDAVPVVHGRWNCSDDMYESAVCSCCGWDTTEPWVHIKNWFQFCPHCGADMRGDKDAVD